MTEMKTNQFKAFLVFAGKVIVAHTVTYFAFGLIMSNLFHYGALFQQEIIRDFMRPIESSFVFLGPLIQPLRGLLFAVGLWPIRRMILESKRGWLIVWNIFVVFGILSTPAAAPSSLEGVIYTKLPLWYHLIGLPEILLQTLAFSILIVWWDKRQYQPLPSIQKNAIGPEILKAVIIACFAYMGYAIGAILSALLAKAEIHFESAASDWKTQMMFVVAFGFNVIFITILARKWRNQEIRLWQVFLLAWFLDAMVPFGYQWIFLSPMPFLLILVMSLFPASILTLGIRLGYRKISSPSGE